MADNNTAAGVNSLAAITTNGADNVAIGTNALAATTSGTQNVALGSQAGKTNAAGNSTGNILIGYNVDVPSNPTNNYLNIGGAIKGDMSVGPITLNTGINFQAKTQSAGDNSNNLATTAYADAAASGTSALQLIKSSTLDTSVSGLLDLSLYVTNGKYTKLILEITKLVSNASSILYVQFANQTTSNTGSNYATDSGGGLGGGALNQPYTYNYVCGDSGVTKTDGSVTIELRGFCNSTTSVLPNITVEGFSYNLGGTAATCYWDSSLLNIACNNLAGKVFDGLVFVDSLGGTNKHTFSWNLYGVT